MKKASFIINSLALILLLFSCEKNNTLEPGELVIAENEVLGLTLSESGDAEDHSVVMEKPGTFMRFMGKGHHLSNCATVTESSEDYPKEIIIDFGENCTDWRGNVKTGKIVINITDDMHNQGAVRTVTYVDFYIGDKKIEGNKTVTNEGQNEDGHWIIRKESTQTITLDDESVISRNSTGTIEWINGFETPEKEDDIFYITGTGTVTKADGQEYTREIIEPLFIDRSCRFILSGIVKLTKDDEVITIDFGDGTCDNTATVTKNGETEEIDLGTCKIRGKQFRMRAG